MVKTSVFNMWANVKLSMEVVTRLMPACSRADTVGVKLHLTGICICQPWSGRNGFSHTRPSADSSRGSAWRPQSRSSESPSWQPWICGSAPAGFCWRWFLVHCWGSGIYATMPRTHLRPPTWTGLWLKTNRTDGSTSSWRGGAGAHR